METTDDQPLLNAVTALLRNQRWATLATVSESMPFASQVAFVCEPGFDSCLLHLSRLAAHTRNLLTDGNASLSIGEPDDGREDPQTLARISLQCRAEPISRDDTAKWTAAQRLYLQRLPAARRTFGFADFVLFRLQVRSARYVGGFADAHTLTPQQLEHASRVKP